MKEQSFCIPCRLPGANETENHARTHYAIANRERQDAEETVKMCAIQGRLQPVERYPVEISVKYYDSTRRDPDNCVNNKVILDALTGKRRGSNCGLGIIVDDSRKYIKRLVAEVVQSDDTYIVVTIREA